MKKTYQNIKLIALDLDGTTLLPDKMISQRVLKCVQKARDAGIIVVIITARPPRATRYYYEQLQLNTLSAHYNGAVIYDFQRVKSDPSLNAQERAKGVIHHQPMDQSTVKRIVEQCRASEPECDISLEILDQWFTDRVTTDFMMETGKLFQPDGVGPLSNYIKTPITKMMLHGPAPMMDRLRALIETKAAEVVEVTQSDGFLLQVADKRISKGVALLKIAEHYGIQKSDTMAVGDAPNDVPMLRSAGVGIAMGNAWPELKAVADHVVGTNVDDGVCAAIGLVIAGC